jgi:hypothetical protein
MSRLGKRTNSFREVLRVPTPGYLRGTAQALPVGKIAGVARFMFMKRRRLLAVAALGVLGFAGSGAAPARAMAPPPTCIRQCSPIIIDTTGPCYGVIVGNVAVDNLCYLGPPPIT